MFSVSNFWLVKISFKQLLIYISILKLFSMCMCIMYVCTCIHIHLCMNVREYTFTYEYWDRRLTPGIFPYFSWFNFMIQSLSLNWQVYQIRSPKDSLTFVLKIGLQAPDTKLTFLQGYTNQNSCPLLMWQTLYHCLYSPSLLVILQKHVPFVTFKYCLKY